MTTLNDLRRRILYLLEDPTGEAYSEELVLDGICSAFDAVLPWAPKQSVTTITGDGATTSFVLPTDYYEMDGVEVVSTGLIIPKANFAPGIYHGETIQGDNDWILFPRGYITFSKVIATGETYTVYYWAQWSKPTTTTPLTETLQTPDFLMTGLAFYAASYALIPTSISTAEVRQYGTKIDSGQPEHNPIQKSVIFLQTMFLQEMNRLPKRARGAV